MENNNPLLAADVNLYMTTGTLAKLFATGAGLIVLYFIVKQMAS